MPDITIPEAAVEAAAQVYFGDYGPSISWHSPSMSEEERDTWRDEVSAYLLAAAPHIAAQALRDAAQAWQINGWAESLPLAGSNPVIAMAQHGTDWLRVRADQIEADHG